MQTIEINEPGARTLADTRRMLVDGRPVTVNVSDNGFATLFFGGEIIAEKKNAAGMTIAEAQAWAVQSRDIFETAQARAPKPVTVTVDNEPFTFTPGDLLIIRAGRDNARGTWGSEYVGRHRIMTEELMKRHPGTDRRRAKLVLRALTRAKLNAAFPC